MSLQIAGYDLIEKIATGGTAAVWKAKQLSLDRIVAIKILDKQALPDPESHERFRKEARTAARLNHPGIVQVFDTGEIEGCVYLAMEFVDGQNVGDYLELHGAMPEARSLEIAEAVAVALAYAWEKECLIHCDINPNNILIEKGSGRIKVADLGISRVIGVRKSADDSDLIIGTPNYMAPEQSAGASDLDCRADMYALGATLYHMLTGQLPFGDARGSEAMTRNENDFLDDPQTVNPELSGPAAWLIEKLMVKNRAYRPIYWTQVLDDVRDVRDGRMPRAPLPEDGASTVRRAASRTAAKPGRPVLIAPKGKPAIKLAIKKSDVPVAAATEPAPDDRQTAVAFRNLIGLLLLAAVVYVGFFYYGRAKGPPEPVAMPVAVLEESADDAMVDEPVTTEAPAPEHAAGTWRNDDFTQGAKFFNQALADYNAYQRNRDNPAILKQVEENSRKAIERFEACRDLAPETVDIDQHITDAYSLISNARFSSPVDTASARAVASSPAAPAASTVAPDESRRKVVFVDDEPAAPEETTDAAVTQPTLVEPSFLTMALATGWDSAPAGSGGEELSRLLTRYAQPSRNAEIDASVLLYPGVTCMMSARDAARALGQELPVKRPLNAPGFPAGSLFYYTFAGDFHGARELALACDRNDRVVMVRLFDDRTVPAKMEDALFSTKWNTVDFVSIRSRGDNDGAIAHRVRRRDNLVRIDTELAAVDNAKPRNASARVTLLMPVQLASLILQANPATP